jgi:hypothetical protein
MTVKKNDVPKAERRKRDIIAGSYPLLQPGWDVIHQTVRGINPERARRGFEVRRMYHGRTHSLNAWAENPPTLRAAPVIRSSVVLSHRPSSVTLQNDMSTFLDIAVFLDYCVKHTLHTPEHAMREKERNHLYLIELFTGLGVYTVLLVAANRYGPGMPAGALRTALLVSPMLGFGLGLWAVVRGFRRMDEYLRVRTLEAIAIAAAVTAGWTFAYGFLENAGFPRLSMFNVWTVMGAVWGGVVCLRRLLNR